MKKCRYCGSKKNKIIKTPGFVHYARRECKECGIFLEWVSAPGNRGQRTGTSKYSIKDIMLHHGYEKAFCFFCGRTKEQLGKNETLTRDHIKEVNEGGKDNINNIQILFVACHKLKNWNNTYIRKHIFGGRKNEN